MVCVHIQGKPLTVHRRRSFPTAQRKRGCCGGAGKVVRGSGGGKTRIEAGDEVVFGDPNGDMQRGRLPAR